MAVLAGAGRGRRARAMAFAMLALALPASNACLAQVDEHMLKAAFVYNIAAFAQWQPAPAGPLTICVDADEALTAAIVALDGRALGGRAVRARPGPQPGACHVLVQGRGRSPATAPGTLTICDACTLPDGASAIALVREGNRIRFDVEPARARVAGVGLSSQLLRLARQVL